MAGSLRSVGDPLRNGDFLDPKLFKRFFVVQLIGLIVLQIVALPSAANTDGVEICFPILVLGMAALTLFGRLTVNPLRLVFYGFFLMFALASQIFSGRPFSGPSFFLLIGLYAPMCVVFDVRREDYLKGLGYYQNIMLLVLPVVIAQHISQVIWGWRVWPNLMQIIPDAFHLHFYNYLQPLHYGSPYYKAQGVVFLEVSFMSQFTALAIIVEIAMFRRLWRLAAYFALLLMSFAGTGLLILAICAPVLLLRAGPRNLIAGVVLGLLLGFVAVESGWFAEIQGRIFEVEYQGTSGYARFVAPMIVFANLASNPATLFLGYGAGNYPISIDLAMPLVKIAFEYGMAPMFAFAIFLFYSVFDSAPSKRVAFACLAFFLYGGGGLLTPVYVLPCILFATLFRVAPQAPPSPALRPAPPAGGALARGEAL